MNGDGQRKLWKQKRVWTPTHRQAVQTAFNARRNWAEAFIPLAMELLRTNAGRLRLRGAYEIQQASLKEDREQATDLRVIQAGEACIGVRVRENDYLLRYGQEFTL